MSQAQFQQATHYLQNGQVEQAEKLCQEVLTRDPDDINFLALLGMISTLLGKIELAIELLNHAIRQAPEFTRAHKDISRAYVAADRLDDAIGHLKIVLEREPEIDENYQALATVLYRAGRGKEADEVMEKLFVVNPHKGKLAKAGELFKQGKYKKAEKLAREVLREDPESIDAPRMLAKLALQANLNQEAEKVLKEIIEKAPGLHEAYLELTKALREQDKFDEAVEYAKQAIRLRPDHFQSYMVLASLLAAGARTIEAIDAYRACLELRKNNPNVYLGYGHVLKTAGKVDEGIQAYRDAIRVKQDNGEAYWSLANLKTYRFSEEERHTMEALLENKELEEENRVHILFSLAKYHEDNGNYENAFSCYDQANQIQRMRISYDPVETEVLHEQIKATFTKSFLEEKQDVGNPDPAPIFIVGLPRSGSTLIEQILSSHSQVDGTSELPDLSKVVMTLNRGRDAKGYPAGVVELSDQEFYDLGAQYIESTQRVRRGAAFFTDKMPNNFPTIGLLSLILPNAKIINARRDPVDSCLGCYKQHFARGQTFTYDLVELGEFYLEYHALMEYWHSVLPGRILDVQYEDMVADQEGQTRRLLEYCGLPFEDACLNFHETDRPVRTASSEQVRQPIYRSSVQTWRRFEQHLQPLIEILEPILSPQESS